MTGFLEELRRRRVLRVLIWYGGVAFIVAEGSDIAFSALGFPPWILTLVVTLLLAGAPVALVLAWVFDITPAGITRTGPHAIVTIGKAKNDGAVARAAPAPAHTIAVMPFENRSGDDKNEYFADGVAEELINAFARAPGLRVAARTSSFAFKGSGLDAREIGDRLGVRRLVEGSVRMVSPKLRLSVQVVDCDDGYSVWAETYERDSDELLAVQQEVADGIMTRIDPNRTIDGDRPAVATANVDAYKRYLRGRYHWNRRTEADLERAIGHFEEAIELDPEYVDAHCGLADAHAILLDYGMRAPVESLVRATVAAERAVTLAPDLSEARTSRAHAHLFAWEWEKAGEEYRRALELNPDYAIARQRYALYLAWMGRGDEAREQIQAALALDPLNLAISASIGWILYYSRKYEEADAALADTLEMDAAFAPALSALGQTRAAGGDFDEAVELHGRAVDVSAGSATSLALLGHALARAGLLDEARRTLARLEAAARTRYVSPYHLALPRVGLGEYDEALAELERAVEGRAATLVYLGVEPIFDPLRSDPRFAGICEAVGLSGGA